MSVARRGQSFACPMPNLPRHHYDEAVRYYREHPGDVMGCAKACGVDWRTASRWWKGPQRKGTPWAVPIRDALALERQRAEDAKSEREAALRAELIEQQAKRKAAEDDAEKLNEGVLKLARSDVLSALGGLARLSQGINELATRVNKMLAEGVDAQGNPLNIAPEAALRILQRYASATKGLVEASSVLLGIDQLRQGLPTSIVGIDVANVSLEEAVAHHALAGAMIEDAKRLGILPSHVDVGRPAPRAYAPPAASPTGLAPLARGRH